jgi:DNA polymerase III psi subunit
MSLNNIRLTPQLIADLYGNVLIETIKMDTAEESIPALGGNEKQILIVVANETETVLPHSELQFLTSILNACKLTLNDVTIVNWEKAELKDYKEWLHRFESRFVLLFDVAPLLFGLPMDFPPFQVQAFDSRQYLFAPALSQIEKEKSLKTALWIALKKLFLL